MIDQRSTRPSSFFPLSGFKLDRNADDVVLHISTNYADCISGRCELRAEMLSIRWCWMSNRDSGNRPATLPAMVYAHVQSSHLTNLPACDGFYITGLLISSGDIVLRRAGERGQTGSLPHSEISNHYEQNESFQTV